jgi:hypothetical protein
VKIKSKRVFLGTLVDIVIGVLVTIFIRPSCWGPIVGVILSVFLANLESLKSSAIVGAITMIPIGICGSLLTNQQTKFLEHISPWLIIPIFIFAVALDAGIGSLYGLVIGFLMKKVKERNWVG